MKPLTALALTAFAPVALIACGGGSSSTPSTAAQSATSTATAKPPAETPHTSHSSSGSAAEHEGSAPFRAAGGDNSIPDYGAEAGATRRVRAAAALAAYLRARAKGDWSAACPYLAASTRAGLRRFAGASKPKMGCAQLLATLSGSAPASARADTFVHGLAALRVEGTKAFALFYGPSRQKYVMPMADESGAWKLAQLAPIAFPLGAPTAPAR